jgi:hypothetical protein
MFQELKQNGFFITAITWRARQNVHPFKIIECDAGFEDGQAGKKFRYSIHGALRYNSGAYTKNLRPLENVEKSNLLTTLERAARSVLADLQADDSSPKPDEIEK